MGNSGRASIKTDAHSSGEYALCRDGWRTQSKRVRSCAISSSLLLKDILHLNSRLKCIVSNDNTTLHCRLYTKSSKISQMAWKFDDNTIVRVDVLSLDDNKNNNSDAQHRILQDIPKKNNNNDKKKFIEKSNQDHDNNDNGNNDNDNTFIQGQDPKASYRLSLNEFYYLFLFMEDKLPEIASFLIKISNKNKNNIKPSTMLNDNENKDTFHQNELNVDNVGKISDNRDISEEKHNVHLYCETLPQDDLESNNDNSDHFCVICLGSISNGVCLSCSHAFCRECISTWEQEASGDKCPICRCVIAQSEMWIEVDSKNVLQEDYIKSLISFPFEYSRLFPNF